MKIVADDKIPYLRGVLEPFAKVEYLPGAKITAADLHDADALLIRTRTCCDEALLAGTAVKFIGTATVGTDHINMDYCRKAGITVASAAGSNAGGVLQWVSATLAMLSASQGWKPQEITLGVIGVGNVGSLIARYASSWGFRVLCSDPPREKGEGLGKEEGFVSFEELARCSDIITFHAPLTHGCEHPTAGLAGRTFFDTVKSEAVIINSARGGIVDERLLEGHCDCGGAACIDTWLGEPAVSTGLLARAYIATPHIAGYSIQGKANATAMVVNALARFFSLPSLAEWYPDGVTPMPRKVISWAQMSETMRGYCDLATQTMLLKEAPASFESFRENYRYREEYF